MSPWLGAPLAIAGVYIAAAAALWLLQEKLIFHPRPTPPDVAQRHAELAASYVADDGAVLRGWLTPPGPGAADSFCQLLIYFGGNSEEVSRHLPGDRLPFAQLYVNYRGYGESDGAPSDAALRRDALALYDETLRRLKTPPQRVCVMGRSLGTSMAIHVAARRDIGRLLLVSPFDSIANIARMRYPIFPTGLLLRHPFDSQTDAAQVTAPTMVLLAEDDWVIPPARSDNLLRRWRGPLQTIVIAGTTHNDMDVADYWRNVGRFLSAPRP